MKLTKLLLIMTVFTNQVNANECVILLHGLARSSGSMKKIAKTLDNAGYRVVNFSYPSTKYPIEKLAKTTITKALASCPKGSKINFVTHSMGGIIVRQYLRALKIKNLGRVVMLGPPNKGSQVVDYLHKVPGYQLINGPAGLQLGTAKQSVPNSLGAVDFEAGIISGTRSFNPVLSLMLPSPDDGKVSVENTKLAGMRDHIQLPATHTFMMNNDAVIFQILYFLRKGMFSHS